jgi:tRNA (cytidine/uridine-2'-O-)-methyltransferase
LFEIVLYQPDIPPNTGNVLRLAANTGSRLHLVKPLGFRLSDRALRRSGLDYGDIKDVLVHEDWIACRHHLSDRRLFAASTRAERAYTDCEFVVGDAFVFGPETRGLPDELLSSFETGRRIFLPMAAGSRSLNLSNAVAAVVYEAWRQVGFTGSSERSCRTPGPT